MKRILWVENTDASEEDISEVMGCQVTVCRTRACLEKKVEEGGYDVIVLDDQIEESEKIITVLTPHFHHTNILVLSENPQPYCDKPWGKNCHRVKEPFDIKAIEDVLRSLFFRQHQ